MEVTVTIAQALSIVGQAASSDGAMSPMQLVMLAVAIGGLTVVMLSTYRKTRRARLAPRTSVREKYKELDRQSTATRDVEKAMFELDQLARQIYGRIDTRFAKLEAVIRDADQRIDTLEHLARTAKGESGLDITLESQKPDTPELLADRTSDHRHDSIYRMADGGMSAADIAQDTGKTKGEIELILALRKTRIEATQGSSR